MSEFLISNDLITQCNEISAQSHEEDFEKLAILLDRKSLSISDLVSKASNYNVAIPSWGTGTGGTRFARYPGKGEPRDIFDKVDDCSVINQLSACTPSISIHIPWDRPKDPNKLKDYAQNRGMCFDAMNSNTFQDQVGQKHSYKYGSLSHTDLDTRNQAIELNIECIELGKILGLSLIHI